MMGKLFLFHCVLLSILFLFYVFHKSLFQQTFLINIYFMNAIAAMLVFNLAYFFRKKHREYIGYYFLFGTILKFFIYFVFVLPIFKLDGFQSKQEFFAFFVPYLLALLVETIALILLLKDNNNTRVKNPLKIL